MNPIEPRVAILIVNFNGKHLLTECLNSVFAQEYRSYEVVVVDNASVDGSAEYITQEFPKARVVQCEKNFGFSGGNNRGVEYIRTHMPCDYIILLNNDTRVDAHWLSALVDMAERHPDAGLIGSKVLLMDAPHTFHSTGILLEKDMTTRNRGMYLEDIGQYEVEEEVFGPIGCSVLVRMNALQRDEALFEECYFAYREDDELSWRMRVYGYKNYYCPHSILWHKHSATTRPFSRFKLFYTERNRIFNCLLYMPVWYLPLTCAITLRRYAHSKKDPAISKGLSEHRMSIFEVVWILLTSYCSALRYTPYILMRRMKIWSRARILHSEVLQLLKRYE